MPKQPHHSKTLQLRGKVTAFNLSPKGHIEGALIETPTGRAQINFPKHDSEALVRSMKVGAKVDLKVELETDEEEHPVYRVCDADANVTGSVVRLNYALHGEVNGCQLDDGTFVHLKPEGANKYKLRVGDRVTATGTRRVGPDAVVLEARAVERVRKGSDAVAEA